MLTPHCSAVSGMVSPLSIVAITRLRKSSEYGFAIPAGLLPAGSLNHIRAGMGIPDSAFSGNALEGGYVTRDRLPIGGRNRLHDIHHVGIVLPLTSGIAAHRLD